MSRRRKLMMLFFSYSEVTKNFITRIKGDGGVIESAKCIDEKLKL